MYTVYITKEAVEKLENLQAKLRETDDYDKEKEIVDYMVEVMIAGSKMPANIFKCTCGRNCTSKSGFKQHIDSMHRFQNKGLIANKRTVKVVDSLDGIQV